MSSLVIDVQDPRWWSLSLAQRAAVCTWVDRSGGDHGNTFRVEITGEGNAIAFVYKRNRNGKRYYDPKIDAAAFKVVQLTITSPPPWPPP